MMRSIVTRTALALTAAAALGLAAGLLTGKYTPEHPPRGLRARKYGLELLTRAQPLISALKKIGAEHDGMLRWANV